MSVNSFPSSLRNAFKGFEFAWKEPPGVYRLRKSLFSRPKSWAELVAEVTVFVFVFMVLGFLNSRLVGEAFRWEKALLISLIGGVGFSYVIQVSADSSVKLASFGIVHFHGDYRTVWKYEDIVHYSVILEPIEDATAVLTLALRDNTEIFFGIPPAVSLDRLHHLLQRHGLSLTPGTDVVSLFDLRERLQQQFDRRASDGRWS